jgi:hypothetical protein
LKEKKEKMKEKEGLSFDAEEMIIGDGLAV